MYPDLIHVESALGMIRISAYTFFLSSAMVVVGIGLYRFYRQLSYSKPMAIGMSMSMLMLAFFGARLMHYVTNISAYADYPSQIYSLGFHGLSIVGAIIAVGCGMSFVGSVKHVPVWKMVDILVPYVGISFILARIGCFLSGCCFGVITQMLWGVRFPLFSDAHMFQLAHGQTNLLISKPVHPTQLYEIIGICIGMIVALRSRSSKRFQPGDTMVVFAGIYFVTRFVTHFFRAYPNSFTTAYLFPFFYIGISMVCFLYVLRRRYLKRHR